MQTNYYVMDIDKLQEYIDKKVVRIAKLESRKEDLTNFSDELWGQKFIRFFNSTYYFFKRLAFLLVGITCIFLFISMVMVPELFLEEGEVRESLIEEAKQEYFEEVGVILGGTFKDALFRTRSGAMTDREFAQSLEKGLEGLIVNQYKEAIAFMGFLLLLLGLVLLYLSRQTAKIRRRNKLLSQKESEIQMIIAEFSETIEEQRNELSLLREIAKGQLKPKVDQPSQPNEGA